MSVSARPRTMASIAFVAAAALSLIASPAWAAEKPGLDYCWQNADNGRTQCFVDEETMHAAVEEQTHTVIAQPGVAARSASALATTYVLATWYEDSGYGGAFTQTMSTNSATCSGGFLALNFSPTFNNRVSSYKTWYGCSGKIYAGANQTGVFYGPSTAAPSVGALNDAATSFKLD
jgi:hypothetical protein